MSDATHNILIATSNKGKCVELQDAFVPSPIRLLRPEECFGEIEVIEDRDTFVGNAQKKADAYWEALTEQPAAMRARVHGVLADDSGIEVHALGGAPGLYSARYSGVAGPEATAANNTKLLRELNATGAEGAARAARFVCVLVYRDGTRSHAVEATWEGEIGLECRGDRGFGYDPLFRLPDGRHAGELPFDEKFPLSHRGQAAAGMHAFLKQEVL